MQGLVTDTTKYTALLYASKAEVQACLFPVLDPLFRPCKLQTVYVLSNLLLG